MTPERWRRLETLYHAARAQPPHSRAAFLAGACADDESMRREVEALLAEPISDEFLAEPALHLASRMLVGPPAPDLTGQTLGGYRLQALLGVGGMGEVYRARDQKLERDVAIKLLSRTVTSSPDRLARFEREARMLAALNHPNICAIHGLEEADSVRFLVLELIGGETLAQRLSRQPLALHDAIAIARQITDALEAAHDKGIVHRDLKPANIKITAEGLVKVLDFGLATAAGADLPIASGAGRVIAGTAAYMSPEQARGHDVDKRTDIWAFGCVFYEMLTGRAAFSGDTVSDTIGQILEHEPDWSLLAAAAPPSVQQLLRRCLNKDVKRRMRDIGDVRLEIEACSDAPGAPSFDRRRAPAWLAWAAAGVLALTLVVTTSLWPPWRVAARPPELRVAVDLGVDGLLGFPDSQFGDAATLSPDGTILVFIAQSSEDRNPQLYVRRLNQLRASALSGTDNAHIPFFSPDGQWVGFFAGGKLKKVAITGGSAETLCDAPEMRGGAWTENETIVFSPNTTAGTRLLRVSAGGGAATPVTTLADGDASHGWPQILPGDRAVLYTATTINNAYNDANLVVQPLAGGPARVVQHGGFHGRYLPSGHLSYIHDGMLFAAPFNLDRLEVTGPPTRVLDAVRSNSLTGGAQFSVSASGAVAYLPGSMVGAGLPLYWMDRAGKLSTMKAGPTNWMNLRFAPDGNRLAMELREGAADIGIYDWASDTLSRLVMDMSPEGHPVWPPNGNPVWTPDGQRIVFVSSHGGGRAPNLYWQRVDGKGGVQRLTDSANEQRAYSWHPNGRLLAFEEITPEAQRDLMILPLDGDEQTGWRPGKPTTFLSGPTNEGEPVFSPDGKWIAYTSAESGSGRPEVQVRPFPGPGGRWQVSSHSGLNPTWSRTTNELFYAADGHIMVVDYTVDGETFRAGTPRVLSDQRHQMRGMNRTFDLHPDGSRFVIAPAAPSEVDRKTATIVLLYGFVDQLRRVVPVTKP